jgi:hypothetical protein
MKTSPYGLNSKTAKTVVRMSNSKTVCIYFGSWTPKKLPKMASHLFYGETKMTKIVILSYFPYKNIGEV